jgi:HAD superfamily hydrolase (TIGR01458 family)
MTQTDMLRLDIRGFIIDIDGVLYEDKSAVPGAIRAIQYLQRNNISFLLATNTTRKSRFSLQSNLNNFGFKVELEQVFSATFAAKEWLTRHKAKSIYLYLRGDGYREFKDFKVTANKPEYIVIGDMGEDLTYDKLNHAFQLIMGGTKIIALQKNRYWRKSSDLVIDAGAIVAALEYATMKKATVIGKPSKTFFAQAVNKLNLKSSEIAVIGDDLESDIKGGQKSGLFTISVQTGKYEEEQYQKSKIKPDLLLPSIAALPKWIDENLHIKKKSPLKSNQQVLDIWNIKQN